MILTLPRCSELSECRGGREVLCCMAMEPDSTELSGIESACQGPALGYEVGSCSRKVDKNEGGPLNDLFSIVD